MSRLGLAATLFPLALVACTSASSAPDASPPAPSQMDGGAPDALSASLAPLKISGNRFDPPLLGAVLCCSGNGANDPGLGWPLVPPEQVDSFRSAGFNVTHVRTGPFSDEGQGWGLIAQLRRSVEYANHHGLYVEVDLVDNWALVHQTPNFYDDNCAVTQATPPPRYLEWVREVVRNTGDLAVLYNLGNEGFRCHPSLVWEDALYAEVKSALAAGGFPDRPVGSTFNLDRLDRKLYDYAAVHGFGAPMPASVPVILNETDNQVHDQVAWKQVVNQANARGTYVMLWRGPDPDDVWAKVLAAFGGHPAVSMPSKPSACWPVGGTWTPLTGESAALVPTVAAAIERVIARRPDLLAPDGNHLAVNDGWHRADFYSLLQAELQPRCSWVGDETHAWGDRDQIDVCRSPEGEPGIFEGYHVINFGGGGIARMDNLARAYRGASQHVPMP